MWTLSTYCLISNGFWASASCANKFRCTPFVCTRLAPKFKTTQKTLRLWSFLTQVIKHTYLADNHSKVILIQPVGAPKKLQVSHGESGSPEHFNAAERQSACEGAEREMSVAIITSQNLTRGNRHESAIVTTDPLVFGTLHDQIQDLIKNHAVPLSELYNAQINA